MNKQVIQVTLTEEAKQLIEDEARRRELWNRKNPTEQLTEIQKDIASDIIVEALGGKNARTNNV